MAIYDAPIHDLDGGDADLHTYEGKALLLVNVASACGLTPQYAGLQKLHAQYAARGFAVLGFPCNQFGSQEPGTETQIREFCSTQYGVTFPLFAKVDVNGANTHPLWQYLKSAQPGLLGSEAIKWNFTKFLVDRKGEVLARHAPKDTPESLDSDIAAAML